MIQVQDIFIYPVKSLAGIKVDQGKCLFRGFELDRRWMLVDNNRKFISQRTEHSLALLKTAITGNEIHVFHQDFPQNSLSLPAQPISKENAITVELWDDEIACYHFSEKADKWFSSFLQKSCKLVYMLEDTERPVDERYAVHNEQVSFADAFPYMLIGQSSLNDLNTRLATPVPMTRFRPSIVVSGTNPYEEDLWEEIKIGDIYFKVTKPCSRCVLVTVDQNTAEKSREPLYTLSRYRSQNNKVMFGQNLLALNEGRISRNSTLKVIKYK